MNDRPKPRGWRKAWLIFRGASSGYFEDRVPQLGAALAFYTTLAVVPLMILIVALAGLVFEQPAARQQIIGQIERLGGLSHSEVNLKPPSEHLTTFGAWVGFIIFLLGGFGVFYHLQTALNVIWRVPRAAKETFWRMVRREVLSIVTIFATGVIILVSLVLSAILSWLAATAGKWAGWPSFLAETANFVFSLGGIVLLFAVLFKFLPKASIRWRDVWIAAVITALLFNLGKAGLAMYLAHSRISSVYGAAGSIVALLTWAYYAGQIFFFGAEISRVQAELNHDRPKLPSVAGEKNRGI
ncbi:MAG: YihY/virulence factor BrkB family protein [Opitutaceae bacterium]